MDERTVETCRAEIIMKNALCSDVALCGLDCYCELLPAAHTARLVNRDMIHSGSYTATDVVEHKRILPRLTKKLEF